MNTPHLFVWADGVINLEQMLYAYTRGDGGLVVKLRDRDEFSLSDRRVVGEFMLHCLQYHAGETAALARGFMAPAAAGAGETPAGTGGTPVLPKEVS